MALAALVGCSSGGGLDDGPGNALSGSTAPVVSAPVTTTPPATVSASPTPTKAPTTGVDVGKYAADPAVQAFASFVDARVTALRRRDPRYAPMLALSTGNRHPVDRALIDRMIRNDEVFEGVVRYVVIGAATTGQRSRIRACQRDDSSWFRNRRTGERSATKPIWTSHDVRVVLAGGTWKVESVTGANFSCSEAR